MARLKRLEAKRWAEFRHMVRNGATTAKLAASVLDRYERRTKTGSKLGVIQLSDPSGQYEAIIFQEGLALYRDLLEKGADVLLTLQANVEGEDVRARITHVESLSEAAARRHKGLRIFVRDEAPLPSIAERLSGRGEGEISLVVMLGPKRRRGRDEAARPLSRHRRARGRAKGGRGGGGGGACLMFGDRQTCHPRTWGSRLYVRLAEEFYDFCVPAFARTTVLTGRSRAQRGGRYASRSRAGC